jgi:hypothetical protein
MNTSKENFDKGLVEIDKKYIEYFKLRPSVLLSQKHDQIINHFITQNSGTGLFTIIIDSKELPLEIREDLLSLFDRCWKS